MLNIPKVKVNGTRTIQKFLITEISEFPTFYKQNFKNSKI